MKMRLEMISVIRSRERRRRSPDNDDEDHGVDTMSQVETNYVKFPDISSITVCKGVTGIVTIIRHRDTAALRKF